MIRSWIRAPTKLVSERIEKANGSSFYILQELGPTGFLLKSGNEKWKVLIGSTHKCNCPHHYNNGSCIHILWVLLKVFQISADSELIYQSGLIEREITDIIQERGKALIVKSQDKVVEDEPNIIDSGKMARPITSTDSCPICLEPLQSSNLTLTHCRLGCGNNIHLKCIKVLMDHQIGAMGFTMVKCPLCRCNFNTVEGLKMELENSSQSKKKSYRQPVQFGTCCSECKKTPIVGKYHKCNVCKNLHLCDECFVIGKHDQHTFQNRVFRNSKWLPSSRNVAPVLPSGFINDLQNREITDEDYQTLLLLDSGPSKQASIPLHIVNSFPLSKYTGQKGGRDDKCKICGDLYHLGVMFSFISSELHRYITLNHHLDRWLLNQRTSCPVCGLAAYCSINEQSEDYVSQEARFIAKKYDKVTKAKQVEVEVKSKSQNNSESIIEIIGTGANKSDSWLESNVFETRLSSFSSSSACSSKHGKRIKTPPNKCFSNNKNSSGEGKQPLESFLFVQSISAMQNFSSSVTKRRNYK